MKALTTATAVPFERTGFDPVGGKRDACGKLVKATKADQLGPVLDCAVAESSLRYMQLYDEQELAKFPAKRPAELDKHAKAIGALAGQLFLFSTDDGRGRVDVVIAVKGDKVVGVVEALPNKQ